MPSVNLIPEPLLLRRLKRRRLGRWGLVLVVVWSVAALPAIRELRAHYYLSSQEAELEEISVRLRSTRNARDASYARLKSLQSEISRAKKLRYKRAWTALTSAVARAMPAGVWLVGYQTDPPRPVVQSQGVSQVGEARRTPGPLTGRETEPHRLVGKSGPRRLLLEGYALGLEEIYVFIGGLNELHLFANVNLQSVTADVVEDIKVTRFVLECHW